MTTCQLILIFWLILFRLINARVQTPPDWAEALQVLCDVIATKGDVQNTQTPPPKPDEQIPLFFANPDVSYANQYALPRFTNGAFRLCLERLYQVPRRVGSILRS